MSAQDGVPITIEFTLGTHTRHHYLANCNSGGLEILFGNQKKFSITVPAKDESGAPANVAFLVRYLCDKLMKDPRKELFVLDDTV
jgi:ubiquitin related modifier 1